MRHRWTYLILLTAATQMEAVIPTPPASAPLTTNTYTQPALATIPSAGVVESTLLANTPVGAVLWDLDVSTGITHPRPGDLTIVLVSPAGRVTTLSHKNGADASFNGTIWDDQATAGTPLPYLYASGSVSRHPYQTGAVAGWLAPEEPLGGHRWADPSGVWKLRIANSGTQTGSFNWSMTIGTVPAKPASKVFRFKSAAGLGLPDGGTNEIPITVSSRCTYTMGVLGARVRLSSNVPQQFAFQLRRPAGDSATLSYRTGGIALGTSFVDTWFREDTDPGGDVPYVTHAGLVRSHPYDGSPVPTLVPEMPLSGLMGQNPNGTWNLRISDFLSNFLAPTTVGVAEVELELTDCTDIEDWNGDDKGDLIFRNAATGQNQLWLMNSSIATSTVPLANFATTSSVGGVGDFGTTSVNAAPDANPDIIWRDDTTGTLAVWFMNGAIVTETSATNPPAAVHSNWKIGGVGDSSGDGKADILWNNRDSGKAVIWYMNGVNKDVGDFTTPDYLPAGLWDQVALADMGWSSTEPELDGSPDLIWRNNTTGRVVVWYMKARIKQSGNFINPMDAGGPDWSLRAVNDIGTSTTDQRPDGWPDLVFESQSTGQLKVFYMKGSNMTDSGLLTPSTPSAGYKLVGPR